MMKVNWKVRFKNKAWLATFIATCVAFVYAVLKMFDIMPTLTEATVMRAVEALLILLASVGVITDPTTPNLDDSERAMGYVEPGTPGEENNG